MYIVFQINDGNNYYYSGESIKDIWWTPDIEKACTFQSVQEAEETTREIMFWYDIVAHHCHEDVASVFHE